MNFSQYLEVVYRHHGNIAEFLQDKIQDFSHWKLSYFCLQSICSRCNFEETITFEQALVAYAWTRFWEQKTKNKLIEIESWNHWLLSVDVLLFIRFCKMHLYWINDCYIEQMVLACLSIILVHMKPKDMGGCCQRHHHWTIVDGFLIERTVCFIDVSVCVERMC